MKKVLVFLLFVFSGLQIFSQIKIYHVTADCVLKLKKNCNLENRERFYEIFDSPHFEDPPAFQKFEIGGYRTQIVIDSLFKAGGKIIPAKNIAGMTWTLIARQLHGYRGNLSLKNPNLFLSKLFSSESEDCFSVIAVEWNDISNDWSMGVFYNSLDLKDYETSTIFVLAGIE